MEQLPQRGSVPQVGGFHTPRLRNNVRELTSDYDPGRLRRFFRWKMRNGTVVSGAY